MAESTALHLVMLGLGFIALIWGAGRLVEGAAALARSFGVSELVIGLTIVALGTSQPEFVVNLVAAYRGQGSILYGNVIGSNLVNLLAILGISGLIFPIAVPRSVVWREVPMSLLATLLFMFLVNDKQPYSLSRLDGLFLFASFLAFMAYIFFTVRRQNRIRQEEQQSEKPARSFKAMWRPFLKVLLGLVLLVIGGELVVSHAVAIATAAGMSYSLVGLTIIATGTSLPELATSVVAAWKGKSDIAVGNIIGSNIFNFCFVAGSVAMVKPAPYDTAFNASLWLLLAGTAFLFAAFFIGKRYVLDRWQAGLLLLVYLLAVGYQVALETGAL
jgi:cation:H+ antiporter